MMRAGTKSRRQALIFMITNAGHSRMGPCWGYHEYGAKVAAGEVVDDAFFPLSAGWTKAMTRLPTKRAGRRRILRYRTPTSQA